MDYRFVWLDDTDCHACRDKFDNLVNEVSSWELFSWEETDFSSEYEGFCDLVRKICIKSMFGNGKIVRCNGLPSFHSRLVPELSRIPEGVVLVIIGRPDTKTTLYKVAREMGDKALVEVPLKLKDKKAALPWFKRRCEEIGIDMDHDAAKRLLDLIGARPSKLITEAKKLVHMGEGKVYPWMIEKACSGNGEERITEATKYLSEGEMERAHEYLYRAISSGEEPLSILGFLTNWARRIVIASSCNLNQAKSSLKDVYKFKKPEKKDKTSLGKLKDKFISTDPNDTKKIDKIRDKIKKEKSKLESSRVLMFPNLGTLNYGFENYRSISRERKKTGLADDVADRILPLIATAQRRIRKDKKSAHVVLHDLFADFLGDEEMVNATGNRSYN